MRHRSQRAQGEMAEKRFLRQTERAFDSESDTHTHLLCTVQALADAEVQLMQLKLEKTTLSSQIQRLSNELQHKTTTGQVRAYLRSSGRFNWWRMHHSNAQGPVF